MDSTDLHYFRVVAEAGGVREAAKLLNIAPSAISRRVTRLEAHLGTKLLDRMRTGTELTATGRRCLTYVHEVHAAKQRLLKDLHAVKQLQSGRVKLHCTEGQLEFISRAVTDFQQQYPKISFDLKIGSAQAILNSIEEGTADLGISFSPQLHPPLESAVRFAAPLLAVIAPTHPLAKRKSLSLEDLQGQSLAMPPEGFALRRIFDQLIRKKTAAATYLVMYRLDRRDEGVRAQPRWRNNSFVYVDHRGTEGWDARGRAVQRARNEQHDDRDLCIGATPVAACGSDILALLEDARHAADAVAMDGIGAGVILAIILRGSLGLGGRVYAAVSAQVCLMPACSIVYGTARPPVSR